MALKNMDTLIHILILTHDLCKFKLCIKQSIFLNETSKNVIIERLKSVWCVCVCVRAHLYVDVI